MTERVAAPQDHRHRLAMALRENLRRRKTRQRAATGAAEPAGAAAHTPDQGDDRPGDDRPGDDRPGDNRPGDNSPGDGGD